MVPMKIKVFFSPSYKTNFTQYFFCRETLNGNFIQWQFLNEIQSQAIMHYFFLLNSCHYVSLQEQLCRPGLSIIDPEVTFANCISHLLNVWQHNSPVTQQNLLYCLSPIKLFRDRSKKHLVEENCLCFSLGGQWMGRSFHSFLKGGMSR